MAFEMIGKASYDKGHWLEATDHIEKALELYKEALGDCYLMCEDGIHVNLTQPDMNPQKKALYEEYSLYAETMEYYELLVAIVKKVCVWTSPTLLVVDDVVVYVSRYCHAVSTAMSAWLLLKEDIYPTTSVNTSTIYSMPTISVSV